MLQILSWMAEVDRRRQREGIDVHYDILLFLDDQRLQFIRAYERWKSNQKISLKAMQEIGVRKSTFYKIVRGYEESI